jgi:large subunit ribosomal protein L24
MKLKFSKNWISSKQTRKQRKYLANAPINIRKRFIVSTFSKELKDKYKRRNFRLRKGDKVKILRGQFKGKTGKVDRINIKQRKIYIPGIENIRKDGTKSMYPIEPSNLMIIELFLEDKKRKEALERKQNG